MKLASRPALATASLLLCLGLGVTGCSDKSEGGDAESQPPLPSGDPSTFQIETTTTVGQVVGRLSKHDRKRLSDSITPVVQRWFNAAYVGGDYPRNDFSDAFPGFTAGARREARHDLALMTNDSIGGKISGVTPKASEIALDVLAVRKRAVAVTARFRLAFKTKGKIERRVGVRGRLLMTRAKPGWRIFAYHVSKTGAQA